MEFEEFKKLRADFGDIKKIWDDDLLDRFAFLFAAEHAEVNETLKVKFEEIITICKDFERLRWSMMELDIYPYRVDNIENDTKIHHLEIQLKETDVEMADLINEISEFTKKIDHIKVMIEVDETEKNVKMRDTWLLEKARLVARKEDLTAKQFTLTVEKQQLEGSRPLKDGMKLEGDMYYKSIYDFQSFPLNTRGLGYR